MDDDARQFDDYASYDVIYFYRPIKDPVGLTELEEQNMKQACP